MWIETGSIILAALLFGQISDSLVQKTRIIAVKDKATFNLLIVKNVLEANAVYNSLTKQATFKVNEVGPSKSWRLVHDGKKVITLFYSKGITSSIYTIFEADSAQKCLDEIKRLNLIDEREFKDEELRK